MREIKFRALYKNTRTGKTIWVNYSVQERPSAPFEYNAMIADDLQYTGLKDKDGVEIYEGDIVRFLDAYSYGEDGDWDEMECKGQIKWDNTLAQFYVTNRNSMDNDDFWEQVDESEVIGNIYEKPELLRER